MRFPTHRALRKQTQRAFTLVEMIGVLAIIAILASLLIPRVFQAIGDSKISNSASTCNSMKAAVNEFYGKYGKICDSKGLALDFDSEDNPSPVATIYENWDFKALLPEGFIEKPFSVRIGNGKIGYADAIPAQGDPENGGTAAVDAVEGSRLRVVKISSLDEDSTTADNGAYNLDGSSTTPLNDIEGALLVEAVIGGVEISDAKALSERIDGPALSAPDTITADSSGRVKYAYAANAETTTVYIYMAHK
jgi:general secretion pathway protein G